MIIISMILSCTTKPIQNNIELNQIDNNSPQNFTPSSDLPTKTPSSKPKQLTQPVPKVPLAEQSNTNNLMPINKVEVIVSSIKVNPTSLSLKIGQTVEFQAIVNMSDGSTNQNTRINVLDTNIIELQQGFKLLGKSEGQTKVEIRNIFDTSKKATIDVLVVKADAPLPPPKIVVESISLSEQNLILSVGEKKENYSYN